VFVKPIFDCRMSIVEWGPGAENAGMNIFCPNCENECSEAAATCPKCGHPLRFTLPPGLKPALAGKDRREGWTEVAVICGALRVIGAFVILGGLAVWSDGCESKRVTASGVHFDWATIGVGVGIIWTGCVGFAIAGIWQAIERAARR